MDPHSTPELVLMGTDSNDDDKILAKYRKGQKILENLMKAIPGV